MLNRHSGPYGVSFALERRQWLSPIGLGEANSHQPENQQNQGQDCQKEKDVGLTYHSGEYLLPTHEEGTGGDEQRKAHAPKMACNPLCARNPSVPEQADIPCGRKQNNKTEKEIHAGGDSSR